MTTQYLGNDLHPEFYNVESEMLIPVKVLPSANTHRHTPATNVYSRVSNFNPGIKLTES